VCWSVLCASNFPPELEPCSRKPRVKLDVFLGELSLVSGNFQLLILLYFFASSGWLSPPVTREISKEPPFIRNSEIAPLHTLSSDDGATSGRTILHKIVFYRVVRDMLFRWTSRNLQLYPRHRVPLGPLHRLRQRSCFICLAPVPSPI